MNGRRKNTDFMFFICIYFMFQDVNMDREQFSSHDSFVFKKRSFAVGTGNYILESYASQCRGARTLLGCMWDGSSYNAVAVEAANPGAVITAFSLIAPRPK